MTLHLLHHQLRHHRFLYPLAAVLIFGSQFLPDHLSGRNEGSSWVILVLLGIAAVLTRLLLRDHPWHSDTACWRTSPITPRTLFASQMLAIGLVVLLPFAAGLLLRILPLALGRLPTALAILVPLATAAALVTTLTACASLATGDRGRDLLPYFAAFVAPMLSAAAYGFVHTYLIPRYGTPQPNDAQILSRFLCGLAWAATAAGIALRLATLGRRRHAATTVLLVAGITLPWLVASIPADFFPLRAAPSRDIGIEIPSVATGHSRPRPSWIGLGEDEIYAPRSILADWTAEGRNVPWRWPNQPSHGPRFAPRLNSDLLRNTSHHSALEDQHPHFAAAVDIPAIWESIRRRLPEHSTWRPAEAPPHIHDQLDLGAGPDMPRFSLQAAGTIYRLESLAPRSPVARGRLESTRPGRLEILPIAYDESQIAIVLQQTIPSQSLGDPFQELDQYSTAPPEFWAVLLHPPSSTAYACHGMRARLHFGLRGPIVQVRHHLLSFRLPLLETRLLGLDPKKILAESELHLFQARPIAFAITDYPQ